MCKRLYSMLLHLKSSPGIYNPALAFHPVKGNFKFLWRLLLVQHGYQVPRKKPRLATQLSVSSQEIDRDCCVFSSGGRVSRKEITMLRSKLYSASKGILYDLVQLLFLIILWERRAD